MRYIKYFILAISLLAYFTSWGQWEEVNIPFDNPSGVKKLEVDLFQANLKITGSDRSDIRVRFKVTEMEEDPDNAQEPEKSRGLKKISGSTINLNMSCQNNIAQIESQNWNKFFLIELDVPREIELDLQKKMGDTIFIDQIKGNINIESNVGEIIAKNITGLVNASTNAGNISVDFDQIPEPKAMMFINTTGSIDLGLPSNYSADFKMKTEMGDIYSDLDIVIEKKPLEVNATTTENGKSNGKQKEKNKTKFKHYINNWTYAKLKQGGPVITINSRIGSIYLRKN